MTKRKIWAILGDSPRDSKMSEEKLFDILAQRVFLPRMDYETLSEYYIQRNEPVGQRFGYPSETSSSVTIFAPHKSLPRNKMGPYERLLYNKLVNPPQNVLFIVGGVGCGKTMTSHLLSGILKNSPQHCSDKERLREKPIDCQEKRLHVLIDFDELDYIQISNFEEAYLRFVTDLSDLMSSNLYGTLEIDDTFEFIDFWNSEINRQQAEGSLNFAFSRIQNEMQFRVGSGWRNLVGSIAIKHRKEIFELIRSDPRLFLDYQCRFWRYVLDRVYKKKRQCVFVILDNIDRASPALQAAIREIVISHQKRFNNTFVVCLRPETLASKPRGAATNVIDVEPHCGPQPFDVVVDRLKRFLDTPSLFFEPNELSKEQEEHAIELSKKVFEYLCDKKRGKILREFMESLVGANIRNALIMATNLLKLKMEDYELGPYELKRALISPPYRRYSRFSDSTVENIFHVEGSPEGRLLVKVRILHFIGLHARGTRTISDLNTMFMSFNYSPELLRRACNEMMQPAHQLVISNNKNEYSIDDFLSSESDQISLTDAGLGYTKKIMYDLDYISMVMLDSVLEDSNFPILSGHGLLRRFRAVIAFLSELNRVDQDELSGLKIVFGEELYVSNFGKRMLTCEIIKRVSISIWRVLIFLERKRPDYLKNIELRIQMIETYRDIQNLMIMAAEGYKKIFGTSISYWIPRPVSQDLRDDIDVFLNSEDG